MINVTINDIEFTTEKELPILKYNNYNVSDFIEFSDGVGVIVAILRTKNDYVFRVLDSNGDVKLINLSSIQKLYDEKDTDRARSKNGSYVQKEDKIEISEGIYKSRTGVVKHIFNSRILFVTCNGVTENNSTITIEAKKVYKSGSDNTSRFIKNVKQVQEIPNPKDKKLM